MSKGLVIVESPAKAKTIQKYLGSGYEVEASLGHIKDLPKKSLGVDLDNNFSTEYVVIPGKEKVVAKLKKLAKAADATRAAKPRFRSSLFLALTDRCSTRRRATRPRSWREWR